MKTKKQKLKDSHLMSNKHPQLLSPMGRLLILVVIHMLKGHTSLTVLGICMVTTVQMVRTKPPAAVAEEDGRYERLH